MIERHLLRLRAREDISAQEEAMIRESIGEIGRAPAGKVLVHAHDLVDRCILLIDGFVARRKDLSDGRSQITELHVPGDFTDLHSFSLKRLDHDVVALTNCTLAYVPHTAVKSLTERSPHLARVYWFMTNLDAAIHREWEVSLGQRSATERMAHLFCEMHARLQMVQLAGQNDFAFPLTQQMLAACLGVSTVHINRTLMLLRAENLIEMERGKVTIPDLRRLQSIADFDPQYLYLEKRPRL